MSIKTGYYIIKMRLIEQLAHKADIPAKVCQTTGR